VKVLVLGGAGYVGCVLVQELLARGHRVRVCDSLFFGEAGLSEVYNRIELETDDIQHISMHHLEGIDAVINLAGISSDPTAEFKPELTYAMNVTGAIRLAHICKEVGVRRYLLASSCSIYDANVSDDSSDVLLDESSPVTPVSAYARSKFEAEQQLLQLADREFSPVLLRKGTIYGFSPRMRFDLVINTLLKDALSRGCMVLHAGGETWRPVVEVRDAARAYVACLEADETAVAGEIFNVVFANFRVCEMALRIREALREFDIATDIRAEYTQRKARSYRVSGEKLERMLGYRPTVSIEDAVKSTVGGLRRHGFHDLDHSKYYNIRWFEHLEETQSSDKEAGVVMIDASTFPSEPVDMYNRCGFTVLKIFEASEIRVLERFAKSWLYRLLAKWTAGKEEALLLENYHIWSKSMLVDHDNIFRAKNRYMYPDEEVQNILINNKLKNFLGKIGLERYEIWDYGWGWLGFRFIRPGVGDGYPLSQKAWGKAQNVVSCWVPIIGHSSNVTITLAPGSHLKEYDKYLPINDKFAKGEYRLASALSDLELHNPRLDSGEIIIYHPKTLHSEEVTSSSITRLNLEFRLTPLESINMESVHGI
jgi:nucleoside-diphosphate-sugar epimerase